jgi:hypothetical protein
MPKQFGVDPGTVQRISRPFAAASVAAGCPLGARNEQVEAESVSFSLLRLPAINTTKLVRWTRAGNGRVKSRGLPAATKRHPSVFIVPLLERSAGFSPQTAKRWPGFRHKPRNQNLCGEIRLKQACGRCYSTRWLPSLEGLGVRIGMDVMLSDYRHWLEYDSLALAVLLVGVGFVELIVLSIWSRASSLRQLAWRLHSITSSVRASSVCGISSPSALAVLTSERKSSSSVKLARMRYVAATPAVNELDIATLWPIQAL